jgi:hypothetical protein
MTAERREAVSPDLAGSAENPATVSQQTTDFTPDPAAGPTTVPAPPGPVPAPPAVFGRYQVRRIPGAGGFGAVYLGHDTQLDRPVAIKALRGGAWPAQAEGKQGLQEARRLAQLRHPGIVAVHDVGVQEGQVYIVSDYPDGHDLGRWQRDHRPAWPEAARIAAAVADALAPPAARPRHPARAGKGLPHGAGEAAAGPVHHRGGLRRRPAPHPIDGGRGAGLRADAGCDFNG